MAKLNGFATYVSEELLADFDGISIRPMFGGYGIYKDNIIFALIADDHLYFKADETTKKDFELHGSSQFMTMKYYELPSFVMDDQEELKKWVETAVQVSLRAKKK
jgi:DNA transformation protein